MMMTLRSREVRLLITEPRAILRAQNIKGSIMSSAMPSEMGHVLHEQDRT